MPFVNKVFSSTIKVLDEKTYRVEACMSTENEDRDGDKIMSAGWELASFLKHPVLLSSHDYYSLGSQIGEWEDVKAADGELRGIARYYVGLGNAEADWGWQLAKMGKAAYSVGFIPKEWKEVKAANPSKGFWGSYVYEKQELLETSHVTIPSNREALQLMAKGMGSGPMREIVNLALANADLWKGAGAGHGSHKWPLDGPYDSHCIVPGCDDAAAISVPICEEHLQYLVNAPAEPPGGELDEEAMVRLFFGLKRLNLKAGRRMSQAGLDQLHAAMTHLDGMHGDMCDMGGDCPRTASMDDDGDETKGWRHVRSLETFGRLPGLEKLAAYEELVVRGLADRVKTPLLLNKAEWSTAYVNDLPDSAFAYVETGGEKDADGKTTPRSLRHFPHHDDGGKLDKDHVDNAAARIPQSALSDAAQARAAAHIRAHQKTLGEDVGTDNGKGADLVTRLVEAAKAGLAEVVHG